MENNKYIMLNRQLYIYIYIYIYIYMGMCVLKF